MPNYKEKIKNEHYFQIDTRIQDGGSSMKRSRQAFSMVPHIQIIPFEIYVTYRNNSLIPYMESQKVHVFL